MLRVSNTSALLPYKNHIEEISRAHLKYFILRAWDFNSKTGN